MPLPPFQRSSFFHPSVPSSSSSPRPRLLSVVPYRTPSPFLCEDPATASTVNPPHRPPPGRSPCRLRRSPTGRSHVAVINAPVLCSLSSVPPPSALRPSPRLGPYVSLLALALWLWPWPWSFPEIPHVSITNHPSLPPSLLSRTVSRHQPSLHSQPHHHLQGVCLSTKASPPTRPRAHLFSALLLFKTRGRPKSQRPH